ncbi:unnamed protein product, partial [Mesorhabditis spiculigera]
MSKVILVALVALLAVVYSSSICDKCQAMMQNARTNYKNDFSQVTAPQLQSFMEDQCNKEFSGLEKSACHKVVDKDSNELLQAFKAGQNNQQICHTAKLC